ncbi:carbohydrate-binding protein, partial [Schumannella luteola]
MNGNPPPIGREIDGILVTAENQADFVHTLNVSVDHNDISDATSDCSDCAPIYLWGINGGGMEVVHNWVHHSGFRAWPGLNHGVGGVYLDGSDLNSDVLVADNLFSNLQKAEDGFDGWIDTMFVSKARARFDNNVLVDCPNTLGVFSNGTDISITHNVVQNCGRNAYVSDGGAAVAIGDADLNLFLAEGGVPEVEGVVGAADLNEWIAQGQFDQQSLIADADFVEDGMHPYQMAYDSPARSLDIHDIDTTSIGLAADHPFTRGQPMSQIALGTDPSAGDGAVRVGVGESVALTVLARDADGFVVDPDSLEYGSDTPSVATVSASGVVTGAGAGLAEITATATRDGATLVRHASVLVDFDTALRRGVLPGHPVALLPELLARLGVDPGSAEVGYCDVDDSIVTVDSDAGACTAPSPATRLELTGVEFGSTAIDVRVREGDDVIRLLLLVEVVQDRLASVSVDLPERVSAGTSAPLDLSASLLSGADLDLSAAEVEYLSSDAGVATVSADGVVSVLTVGTVTVTARVTYDGVSVDGITTIRNRDARARTDGGDYDAKSYPVLDLNGTQIKNTGLGGWAEYRNVDFGTGVDRVDVEIGVNANNAGRAVEFRLDAADGPLIGTLTVANTGTFNVYTTQSTEIGGVRGVHDLYLVFPGTGITAGNLRAFTFVGGVLDHVAPVISTDLEDGQFVAGTQDVRVTVVEENPLAYHAQLYTRDGVAVPGIAAYAYKPQSGELVI